MHTDNRINDPDGIYEQLVGLHTGLSSAQSAKVNAKLILLMANHIGDDEVLREIFSYARQNLDS